MDLYVPRQIFFFDTYPWENISSIASIQDIFYGLEFLLNNLHHKAILYKRHFFTNLICNKHLGSYVYIF